MQVRRRLLQHLSQLESYSEQPLKLCNEILTLLIRSYKIYKSENISDKTREIEGLQDRFDPAERAT